MKYIIFTAVFFVGIIVGSIIPIKAQENSTGMHKNFDTVPVEYASPSADFQQQNQGGAGCGI